MPQAPVLSSPFRYEAASLWWGRARLFGDRLLLWGMGWRGLHRRTLQLHEVARVTWLAGLTDRRGANLILDLHSGETVALRVKNAGLWKFALEERAPNLLREAAGTGGALHPAA